MRHFLLLLLLSTPAHAEWTATRVETRADFTKPTHELTTEAIEKVALVRCSNGTFARRDHCPGYAGEPLGTAEELSVKERGADGLSDGWSVGWLGGAYDEASAKMGAWYARPTTRYPHGALGDTEEAGALRLRLPDGSTVETVLPETRVFEDRNPILTDLEGVGGTQVVTILADANEGAAAAVYDLKEGALELRARTPFIGTPNRWLNIAGLADFDGAGFAQIALVKTPHIGGILQFWRYDRGELKLIAEAPGFSNHAYRAREQRLSAVEDFDGDGVTDLALPSADRRSLKLVKLSAIRNPDVVVLADIPFPAPIDKAIGVTREGGVVLTVGLEDGSVWAVHEQ